MEKTTTTNNNSNTDTGETPGFDLSMDEKELEELLNNTINLYFKENECEELKDEKAIINYFYQKEFICIEYVKRKYDIKEKRLIIKNLIMGLIFEKFKLQKFSQKILKKFEIINNYLILRDDITIEIYYEELQKKFNIDNFPKFLIKETLIRIKNIVSIRLYEQNLDNKLKDVYVKNLIYFYEWLNYSRNFGYPLEQYSKDYISIPDSTTPFDILFSKKLIYKDDLKNILFHIFILSNASVIKNNKYTHIILEHNYSTIISWFNINKEEHSFNFENLIENFISLDNIEELLRSKIEYLFENYIDTKESLISIIASFFYCITREIEDINSVSTNEEKFKFSYLLDNVIHNIQKYSKDKIDNFNIKEMISYLDYFQIIEDLNDKKINPTYKFKDIETILTNEKLNYNLNERFKEIIVKIKETYPSNFNLIPMIKDLLLNYIKVPTFFSEKILKNRIELIPFSKKYYSNKIIILISGFGAEKDDHPELWKQLINSNRRGMYYFYQWPGDSIGKIFIKMIGNSIPFIGEYISNASIPNIFMSAKKRASYCGKILALILASRKFFGNCQIDLIGFSLGCHVIKNCLKELYSIENLNHNIINTVMFIAGATHIKNNEKWEKIFNRIITGRIINCYSKSDKALQLLFQPCVSKNPIGRIELNIGKQNMRIENFDMSDLKMRHIDYRRHFKELIDKVNL